MRKRLDFLVYELIKSPKASEEMQKKKKSSRLSDNVPFTDLPKSLFHVVVRRRTEAAECVCFIFPLHSHVLIPDFMIYEQMILELDSMRKVIFFFPQEKSHANNREQFDNGLAICCVHSTYSNAHNVLRSMNSALQQVFSLSRLSAYMNMMRGTQCKIQYLTIK